MKRFFFFLLFLGSCSIIDGHKSRPYAEWKLHGSVRPVGSCATVEPWVVKSGAEGVAFVFEFNGRATCALAPTVLEMKLGGDSQNSETVHRDIPTAPASMTDGAIVRIFVPAPFDNRAAWNRGSRSATLFLRGTIDGAPFEAGPWTLDQAVPQ